MEPSATKLEDARRVQHRRHLLQFLDALLDGRRRVHDDVEDGVVRLFDHRAQLLRQLLALQVSVDARVE